MSTQEEMAYLEEEQTLRNKDYVTIKRTEYARLTALELNYTKREREYEARLRRLQNDEKLLESQKKFAQKKEYHIKYALHKRFKEMTAEILKMDFNENMPEQIENNQETV